MLGGYETCFGISLDPKTIDLESKRAEKNFQSKISLPMLNEAIFTNGKQTYFSS